MGIRAKSSLFIPFKIQKSWKVLMLTYTGGVSDEGKW